MKKSLLATTALLTLAASAHAVDAKFYGVVNKAAMQYSDGKTSDFTVVDNNLETTRLGIAAEQKLDNGFTAGALFESEMSSNNSASVTQNLAGTNSTVPTNASTPTFSERMARVSLGSDAWGTLLLGQQDVATDDTFTHDLAPAGSVMNANTVAFGGGLKVRDTTGAQITVNGTGLTLNDMALGMNGALDAADAIRYNTPTFGGFNGSASASQGGNADLAARYGGTFGSFTVDGAVGHKFVNGNNVTATNEITAQTFASASVAHTSGFAGTLAYTGQSLDKKAAGVKDPKALYAKLGYAWGPTGVAVDWSKFDNAVIGATHSSLTSYGIGAEHTLTDGVTLGALYKLHKINVTGISNEEDINIFAVNMRVHF